MNILITNDDGINAPGLLALVQAVRKFDHKIIVLAPDHNWSASGHVKTMHRPLRVSEALLADGSKAWKSDGAPSDCVALALMGVFESSFDVVISGINPNANLGHDVTYSGTVTAAMEASISGKPGFAVSLDAPEHHVGYLDFSGAANVATDLIFQIIQAGFQNKSAPIYNINIPYLPREQMRGVQITRLGLRIYRDELVKRIDPRGRAYYWIGGDAPTGKDEVGTDFGALKAGYVSITPLQLDLTDYEAKDGLHLVL
jgi:5'-nucleotidase